MKESIEELLPCPFCGKEPDLEDHDTLYPSGAVWRFDEELGLRTYHGFNDKQAGDGVCYGLHCPGCSGGCGAEIHGDSKEEAIAKWNARRLIEERSKQGAQPVGEVMPQHDLCDEWLSKLPVGTKLYTHPAPQSDEAKAAARYRFLRDDTSPYGWQKANGKTADELDSVIDAAIAAKKGEK